MLGWLLRRKFLLLLLSIVAIMLAYPALHGSEWGRLLFGALYTVLFAAALVTLFAAAHHRALALMLGAPTLVVAWVGYWMPGVPRGPALLTFHLAAAVFLLFTLVAVLRVVYDDPGVTREGIYGAFCGYLLIGMIFGHLFCALETAIPGSFQGSEAHVSHLKDEDRRFFLLTYVSLVTLTTMGYADILPTSPGARGLAVIEALVAQFYLAVLVAELVGKRLSQVLAPDNTTNGSSP